MTTSIGITEQNRQAVATALSILLEDDCNKTICLITSDYLS